jgi:hypothetical protein
VKKIVSIIKNFGVKNFIIILLLLIFSFTIRVYNPGEQGLWADEAFTVSFSKISLVEMFETIYGEAHPPLYYLIMHVVFYLGDSEFIARLPSVIFSILTVIIIFSLAGGKEYFFSSLISSILFGFSCYSIEITSMARMYSLQCFLSVLCVYFLRQCIFSDRRENIFPWIAYTVTSVAMIYTQYTSFIFLFSINIYYLICWKHTGRYLFRWILSNIAIIILFLPWIKIFLLQSSGGYGQLLPVPDIKIISDVFLIILYGGVFSISYDLYPLILIPPLILFLAGIYNCRKQEICNFYLPVALFLIPLCITLIISVFTVKRIFSEKHFFYAIPFLYIILARGFYYVKSRRKLLIIPLALLFLSLNVYSIYNINFVEKHFLPDWKGAVNNIEKISSPGDIILVQDPFQYFPFSYYYRGHMPLYTILPANVPSDLLALSRSSKRIWLVRCQDWHSDPQGIVRTWLEKNCKVKEHFVYYRIDRASLITVDLYEAFP